MKCEICKQRREKQLVYESSDKLILLHNNVVDMPQFITKQHTMEIPAYLWHRVYVWTVTHFGYTAKIRETTCTDHWTAFVIIGEDRETT